MQTGYIHVTNHAPSSTLLAKNAHPCALILFNNEENLVCDFF